MTAGYRSNEFHPAQLVSGNLKLTEDIVQNNLYNWDLLDGQLDRVFGILYVCILYLDEIFSGCVLQVF